MAALLQVSFLSVVFPEYRVPNIGVALVVAWTIHVGFVGILPWVVILGLITDIVGFQSPGVRVILFVVIAYFVSFISRRFLVAHRVWGPAVTVFFLICATALHYFFELLLAGFDIFLVGKTGLFWETIMVQISVNIVLFLAIYFPLGKAEEFIAYYDKQIKIK